MLASVIVTTCVSNASASHFVQRRLANGTFETLVRNTHYTIARNGTIQVQQAAVDAPAGDTATLRFFMSSPTTEDLPRIDITAVNKPIVNVYNRILSQLVQR